MKKETLVLAYSGGLDTSYSLKKLSLDNYEVHAVSVNTGGFSEKEIDTIEAKAYQMGAFTYQNINAIKTFYKKIVKYLLFGNVLKNNTYPLSVSAERIIQAIEIVRYAKKVGAKYIAHGSTGAGNDQVRFDLIFQVMAPKIKIVTLIRDNELSREDEIEYLKTQGIDIPWEKAQYSINQGLWGTSVGGAETLTSHLPLPDSAYPNPLKENEPLRVKLQFEKGELVGLNENKSDAVSLIQQLQELAQKYAIGRDIHVGDTIIGIKGRVGFEAAAPLILIKAHHLLEKHTLSKWQQYQKEQLANFYGMQLHEGHYLDPALRDIEAFMESSQERVTGSVFVTLHPYRFELLGIESPFDLMQAEFGSYGEINKGWTATDAKGFIKLTSNATKIYQHLNTDQ
ncbi:MAG: argininosuccinate synthase [Flavobacteriaceae bacterium]|jgi:argininosuccinate synthase|nr:argininosuccinate synthase [Flavobacteriaceae bacterium]